MNEDSKKNQEIELLKLEYQECQRGYSQRDGLAEDEFGKVVQLFLLLVATVFLFDRFAESGRLIHCSGCIILGVAGLFYFLSLLVSIESNASCNVALRQRCEEIEKRLRELTGFELRYWKTIHDRVRHFEEMVIKGAWGAKADREKKERERNIFINTVRLLIFLWIIVVLFAILPQRAKQEKTVSLGPSVSVIEPNKPG
jgi:hypothetical protein